MSAAPRAAAAPAWVAAVWPIVSGVGERVGQRGSKCKGDFRCTRA